MDGEKQKKVHPIVKKALEIAYKEGDTVNFDEYAVEQLQDMLKQYFGKLELRKAVIDLINLAGVFEEQGFHAASMRLMMVVSIAADALKELNDRK